MLCSPVPCVCVPYSFLYINTCASLCLCGKVVLSGFPASAESLAVSLGCF